MSFTSKEGVSRVEYERALTMSDKLRDMVVHYIVTRELAYTDKGNVIILRTYRTTNLLRCEGLIIHAFNTNEELKEYERQYGLNIS